MQKCSKNLRNARTCAEETIYNENTAKFGHKSVVYRTRTVCALANHVLESPKSIGGSEVLKMHVLQTNAVLQTMLQVMLQITHVAANSSTCCRYVAEYSVLQVMLQQCCRR